jgi:hypothetical protein
VRKKGYVIIVEENATALRVRLAAKIGDFPGFGTAAEAGDVSPDCGKVGPELITRKPLIVGAPLRWNIWLFEHEDRVAVFMGDRIIIRRTRIREEQIRLSVRAED